MTDPQSPPCRGNVGRTSQHRATTHEKRLLLFFLLAVSPGVYAQDAFTLSSWVKLAGRMDFAERASRCADDLRKTGALDTSSGVYGSYFARIYEAAGRYGDAIRAYENIRVEQRDDRALLQLVQLYGEQTQDTAKTRSAFAQLQARFPRSPLVYAASALLRRIGGDASGARALLDSGLTLFPDHSTLRLTRLRFSVLGGDTLSSSWVYLLPDVIPTADTHILLDISVDIERRSSPRGARSFLETVERRAQTPYPIWRRLAGLYRTLKLPDREMRVMMALCVADSTLHDAIRSLQDPGRECPGCEGVKAEILGRMSEHVWMLLDCALALERTSNYALAREALTRTLHLPQLGSVQRAKAIESLMIMNHRLGNIEESRLLGAELLREYGVALTDSPSAVGFLVRRAICHFLLDDFLTAETDLREHARRATDADRRTAVEELSRIADLGINEPDIRSAIAKFYPGVVLETVPRNVTPAEHADISRMALESFTESGKVNPEADKAYVLVRSLVPMLRFDSNRTIHKVEQVTSGDWELWLPAGTHILKIDAAGYQRLELPPINFARRRSYEISIRKSLDE